MNRLVRKLKTAGGLPFEQWLILIKCWLMLLYIRSRMTLTPFKSWKHWLTEQPTSNFKPLTDDEKSTIDMYRRLTQLASRYHFVKANCLPKSLALKWLLKKENIQSQLKLGINSEKNRFQGHAWLVRGDLVLNDSEDVALRYPVEQELGQKPVIN